jgi:hypothetical protein
MELGGTARGTQHDALNVTRDLTFGGTLTATLTGGFLPQAGQAFDLFDFDAALDAGSFDTITLPSLTAGLAWDTSALYTTGTLSVIALAPIEQWHRIRARSAPARSVRRRAAAIQHRHRRSEQARGPHHHPAAGCDRHQLPLRGHGRPRQL